MGIINPTATLLSAAMMLRYLNLGSAADRLETAIADVYLAGSDLTPDQGGDANTERFADAVIGAL
jgi:homoisocitrate dehydrogenase